MSEQADLDARLAAALHPFLSGADGPTGGVLLAVSGGPDSTALLHAAVRAGTSLPLFVATVDHGLRPGSSAEASMVAALAGHLGVQHRILTWAAPRPASGIQEAARAARYALLAGHAVEVGAATVLTAHTADDQAETVLLRLIAGSGPAGLAGMRRERRLADGVRLVRPFLDLPKADLVAYCDAHGLAFVRDPSNADERYARAWLRRLMPMLETEGLSAVRLCRLAERLARDEAAHARTAGIALADARRPSKVGSVRLDGIRLAAEPEAIVLRVIDAALDAVQSHAALPVPHRLERLERLVLGGLLPALKTGAPFRATLRGVLVEAAPDGAVRLAPAPPRRAMAARHSPPPSSLAAAVPDLLGKGEPAAYIGRERVE